MNIQSTIHVLAVANLERTAIFYRDVLGFTIHEMNDSGWQMFEKEGCRIMAGHCPDATPASELGDHSYFGYFVVDNVDKYYASVLSKGAEITKQLKNEPWKMREFGVKTIDGHRLMIGQDLAK
ncbi:MAG: VOC family protein [Limnothrix sp.]